MQIYVVCELKMLKEPFLLCNFRYIHIRIDGVLMCRNCFRQLETIVQNVEKYKSKILGDGAKRCLLQPDPTENETAKRRLSLPVSHFFLSTRNFQWQNVLQESEMSSSILIILFNATRVRINPTKCGQKQICFRFGSIHTMRALVSIIDSCFPGDINFVLL